MTSLGRVNLELLSSVLGASNERGTSLDRATPARLTQFTCRATHHGSLPGAAPRGRAAGPRQRRGGARAQPPCGGQLTCLHVRRRPTAPGAHPCKRAGPGWWCAMKAFMKADLYKPVRVVGSGQRGGRERGAGVVPRQDLGRRCVSVTHLSNARTHAALRHAPPRGARAGAGAPGRHLRPEVLLGAWARRAQDRVAPPTPAFCCVSNDHETANAARLHCAAHACDETATTLTRAGGAFPSRFPALPLPSSGA